MRKFIFLVMATGTFFLVACHKDNIEQPDQITTGFTTDSLTLDQAKTEAVQINIKLSDTLREKATITLALDDNSTASMDDFTSDPAFVNGKLELTLEPGSSSAAFTVSAANSTIDNKVAIFQIASVFGGAVPATTGTLLKLAFLKDAAATPAISVSVNSLEDFGPVDHGKSSVAKSYAIKGANLTDDVWIVAPLDFEVSLDNQTFKDSVLLDHQTANTVGKDIYVHFTPISGKNIALTGNIRNYSKGATDKFISVSGVESGNTESSTLLKEDFDYGNTPGDLTSLSTWKNYSGTANPIQYLPAGLDFSGYGGSGVGGAISFHNGSGSREDITRSFNEQNTGTVYLTQMVNLSSASASASGDFFISLRDAGGGYFSRLYAKDDAKEGLLFGVAKTRSGSEPVLFSPTVYAYNKTYLVIVKYDFSKKSASLYVLSGSIASTEPTADVTSDTGGDAASLVNIVIRQSTDDIAGNLDGIRITKTLTDATGK